MNCVGFSDIFMLVLYVKKFPTKAHVNLFKIIRYILRLNFVCVYPLQRCKKNVNLINKGKV